MKFVLLFAEPLRNRSIQAQRVRMLLPTNISDMANKYKGVNYYLYLMTVWKQLLGYPGVKISSKAHHPHIQPLIKVADVCLLDIRHAFRADDFVTRIGVWSGRRLHIESI